MSTTLKRSSRNPILTRRDLPDMPPHVVDATAVFNPGAVKYGDKYLLMLRVQTRGRETLLVMAQSDDGVEFAVSPEPVQFRGIEQVRDTIYHIYDPRLTQMGASYYVMFAADMDSGCRLGVARTVDFKAFEFVGLEEREDMRNGVLFPERIDDRYVRLDRPNRRRVDGGATSGDEIFLSTSSDLKRWERLGSVMRGRPHYWDELIGSGPPPVKTAEGWLHVYHGVARHLACVDIYQAGAVLLDLEDPRRVKARTRNNILEPREAYEHTGRVPNVVFPTGMIVDDVDDAGFAQMGSNVHLYYGAADTSVALATTTVEKLLAACHE